MSDLSHDAPDDGFHEIQLSGKQLVFLFMATTVVSVVIFLCGVLVGRGVRGEPLRAEGAAPPISTGGPGATANPTAPPPLIGDAGADLSYTKRLGGDAPVDEKIKEPKDSSAPTAATSAAASSVSPAQPPVTEQAAVRTGQAAVKKEAPVAPPAPTPAVSAAADLARPRAGVWAVQVVALTDQAAATAVVRRLSSKGYSAYLVQPPSGAAVQNYKVQVGRFEDRSEAEVVASRLKKEEQFQPWILR